MVRFVMLLFVALTWSIAIEECSAQRMAGPRVPNYTRRPVISPYVNLFNNNQGGINNYFSLVRPMQQQQLINQQQFNQNRYLQQQLAQPYQQGYGPMLVPPGSQGMFRPTGAGVGQPSTAASFFNYSHFYNMPNATRRQ